MSDRFKPFVFVLAALICTCGVALTATPAFGADATVTVNYSTVARTIPSDFHGVNYVAFWDDHQGSLGSREAMRRAGVKVIRFPGGAPADWHDWDKPTTWTTTSTLDLRDYANVVGASIMFQTNPTSNTVNDQGTVNDSSGTHAADWVSYCINNNVNVPYWEVGNEPDLHMVNANDYGHLQWYFDKFNEHAPAMKARSSSIKVAGPAGTNAWQWWGLNSLGMFIDQCDQNADAISLHWYTWGTTWDGMKGQAQNWQSNMDFIRSKTGKPIWITEWNVAGGQDNDTATWAGTALANADIIGAYAKSGVERHTFFGNIHHVNTNWGILAGGTDYRPLDSAAPSYFILPLWSVMGTQVLNSSNTADAATRLSTWSHKKSDGSVQVMLVNKGAAMSVDVAFSGFDPTGRTVRIYELRSNNGTATTRDVYYNGTLNPTPATTDLPAASTATAAGSVFTRTLPALSVTVLDFSGTGGGGGSPPPAPTNLTATAGNAQVALSWSASSGATSYNVKRSTTSGSGYTTVASPTTTSYTNTGLTNGTTYYYVVSAVNSVGESANSSQATATPQSSGGGGGLPSGWTSVDIGGPSPAGSASASGGTWTVSGGGADIWGKSDQFHYVYTDASGDTSLIARVDSVQNTNTWAKSGVMFRDGTAANARYAAVVVTPGNGVSLQWRTKSNGATASSTVTGVTAPRWVRLVRSGNSFTASYGSDGTSWTQIGSGVNVSMATSAKAGLCVTSHSNGTLCTSTFSNVSVGGSAPPPPQLPAAPTNLAATAGDAQVALGWSASSGADSYNVKRSTTSGSGYTTVASPTTTSYTNTGLTNGTTYYYVVSAVNIAGESGSSNQASATPTAPSGGDGSPYGGTARVIPGTIQLEDYNTGGQNVAYSDADTVNSGGQYRTGDGVDIESCTEGGFDIAYIVADEWLKYTVNVGTAGTYDINIRYAGTANGSMRIEFGGVDKTGTIALNSTGGWQTWSTKTVSGISLSAGQQVMRVVMLSGGYNLNYVSVTATPTTPPLYIYDDAVAADWADWSWSTTVNFSNTSPVRVGARSTSATYTAGWGALSLRKGTVISTSGYSAVKFWVHGGTGSNKAVKFDTQTADGSGYSTPFTFTATAGTWTEITVPMSSLGSPSTIKRVNFQENAGAAQSVIYFDDIRLVP